MGRQAEKTGDISSRGFVWGAGMATRKLLFETAFSKYHSLLPGRSGSILSSGDDNEYCLRLLFMGYRLFYDENLQFVHYIPSGRLTEDYIYRLGEGFKASYTTLSKYSLLLFLRSLPAHVKVKTFLSSCLKLIITLLIAKRKWSRSYDAMVIYFLTGYRLTYVSHESALIKRMYNEFRSSGYPVS